MLACPPYRDETSTTIRGVGSRRVSPSPQNIGRWAAYGRAPRLMIARDGGHDASPTEETRSGRPSSHAPIRTERPTLHSHTLPPGRDETIRPRDRARSRPLRQRRLNRKTLNDRPTPLTIPQRTTDHPKQPVERGNHDSQTRPEKDDARIDDEPFHNEAHRAAARATTMRKPPLGAHTTRVVERAGKRNTVTKTHFRSDLSRRMG